jgi:MFS family permease
MTSIAGQVRAGLAAVLLAQFIAVLDGLIVSVAIPDMTRELQISTTDAHWVLNAYAVALAGLLPLGGKIADTFGRRRIFLAGQAVLLAGSIAGALAPSETVVLVARVVQAAGAALSSPAGLSLLADTFRDERERSRVFGWLPIGGGIGWVSAALFGGLLTAAFGWQSVFLVNVPISLAAIVLARIGFEGRTAVRGERIDWRSSVLLIGCLGVAVYTLGAVQVRGLFSLHTFTGLGIAALLGLAFARVALRSENPVLRLELLRRGGVPGAVLLGLALPVGFVATQFLGSNYLQANAGMPPDQAGYMFLPLTATPLLVAPLVGRYHPRIGTWKCVAAGYLLAAAGLAVTALAPAYDLPWWLLVGFGLIGTGLTIVYVPLAVAAVTGIDDADYGAASALFSTSNQVGGSLALAVLSSVAAGSAHSFSNAGLAAGLAVAAVMTAVAGLLAFPLLKRI